MKKIGLVNLVVLAIVFLVTSCVVETKKCEDDHLGTVKVTNNTGEYWDFDVTYEQNSDGTWVTNDEQRLSNNENYKWEDVSSGTVTIWAHDAVSYDWQIVDTVSLGDCEDYTITYASKCDLFNTGDAKVVNNTGSTLVVDVAVNGTWTQERTLYDGYTATYTVKSGTVKFGARLYGGSSWTFSGNHTLETCGEFTQTWNAGKMATGKKGPKVNNAAQTIKALKVAK